MKARTFAAATLISMAAFFASTANAVVLDFTGQPATVSGLTGYKSDGFKVLSNFHVFGYPDAVMTNLGNGVTSNPGNWLTLQMNSFDPLLPFNLNSIDIGTWWLGGPGEESPWWASAVNVELLYRDNTSTTQNIYVGRSEFQTIDFDAEKLARVLIRPLDNRYQLGLSNITINEPILPPVSAVPEPSTYMMMVGGLGLMGFVARRKKTAHQRASQIALSS